MKSLIICGILLIGGIVSGIAVRHHAQNTSSIQVHRSVESDVEFQVIQPENKEIEFINYYLNDGKVGFEIRNNLDKKLNAAIVAVNGEHENEEKKKTKFNLIITFDHNVHPKISELHKLYPLSKGERFNFLSKKADESTPSRKLSTLTLKIGFAEFEDGMVLGDPKLGEETVYAPRRGAKQYYDWLLSVGNTKENLLKPITGFQNDFEASGAKRLQRHLLKAHNH